MKIRFLLSILLIMLAVISTTLAYRPAYAYFDRMSSSAHETLTIGRWRDLRTLFFSDINLNDFVTRGPLNQNSEGLTSSFGFFFIETNSESYVVTLVAQMSAGNNGGYGIVFDSTLDGNNHTGYIIQLDRGFGPGAVILREWIDGSEQSSGSPLLVARANSTPGIPGRNQDPSWWTEEKTLRLEITKLNETQKSLTFFVDDVLVFENEVIESSVPASELFVGFRAWGTSSTFKSMTIE